MDGPDLKKGLPNSESGLSPLQVLYALGPNSLLAVYSWEASSNRLSGSNVPLDTLLPIADTALFMLSIVMGWPVNGETAEPGRP